MTDLTSVKHTFPHIETNGSNVNLLGFKNIYIYRNVHYVFKIFRKKNWSKKNYFLLQDQSNAIFGTFLTFEVTQPKRLLQIHSKMIHVYLAYKQIAIEYTSTMIFFRSIPILYLYHRMYAVK